MIGTRVLQDSGSEVFVQVLESGSVAMDISVCALLGTQVLVRNIIRGR
jgi:hypothetical protein